MSFITMTYIIILTMLHVSYIFSFFLKVLQNTKVQWGYKLNEEIIEVKTKDVEPTIGLEKKIGFEGTPDIRTKFYGTTSKKDKNGKQFFGKV